MANCLEIQSHKGVYTVSFISDIWGCLSSEEKDRAIFVLDDRLAQLYDDQLRSLLSSARVLLINASESNKSLECFPDYVNHLMNQKLRRDHCLVAIGGGIIQDITCFLAATMFRGLNWHFYPSTLLAQADSCIGSKSSMNCAGTKNILGTFTPPKKIIIGLGFLDTLEKKDVCSGVGEMLKVHALAGVNEFSKIAEDYEQLFVNKVLMQHYILRSLEIKKKFIEEDEFDRGVRNVMNYGHSFGHAIEAATQFSVPHGIAVTMGMDMANYVAMRLKLTSENYYRTCHETLLKNYQSFESVDIPENVFFQAISKDKKNIGKNNLSLILPDSKGRISKYQYANDECFRTICRDYFQESMVGTC